MNQRIKQFCVLLFLIVGTYVAADQRAPLRSPAEPTLGELERRIQLLEDRIQALEVENRNLRRSKTSLLPAPTQQQIDVPPKTYPAPPAVNDYWHKGIINGRPFYVIPVGHEGSPK